VFLVNHQRNIPALDRDHANVFTKQQIEDAVQNGMGLMTTWDLFRLTRGMKQWNWPGKAVQDVFYGKGRLRSVPSHYVHAGEVVHCYSELAVLSVEIRELLHIGDTVAWCLPKGFAEETVTSLQIDKKAVEEAHPGQRVGYKTQLKRNEIRVGSPMYLVRRSK
jgi:hypothetical protein